jgi:hypothetical protein
MARKLFIVQRGNAELFAMLRRTLANEPDVEILYDRRAGRSTPARNGAERRAGPDVAVRIQNEGFAVARPASPPPVERNVRWA